MLEERFQNFAKGSDEAIDLAEGALLIAAEEYPTLDVRAYQGQIERLGATLKRRLRPDIGRTESILALNRYLFDELGFHGASDNYYDPRNSFLNDVLDRRVGIPITLSILYIVIGRQLGLSLDGVSFPGHFLVRCALRNGTVVLDPYHRGISLGIEDLQKRLAPMQSGAAPSSGDIAALLVPASNREILARLLRNLRGIYLHFNQHQQALATSSHILALQPENAAEWRERGQLYLNLECFRAALSDFQTYVALAPNAEDMDATRARIVDLQRTCARLN